MRLISLHVENFGKLQNYDDTFDAGLNARLQDNGWGKSTLAVFIKAMLYGLAATTRRSLIENERKRYTPWQGGAFGGSLDIEVEGKCYRIERLFGAKEAEDTLTVTDLMTGRDADVDWASEPGERLLGVDSAAYERSTYLSQRPDELSESGMDSIHTKLNRLVDATDDLANFDTAVLALEKRRQYYRHLRGDGGAIAEGEAELAALDRAIERTQNAASAVEQLRARLQDVRKQMTDNDTQLEALEQKQSRWNRSREAKAVATQLEALRQEEKELREQLEHIRATLGGNVPTEQFIHELQGALHAQSEARARLGAGGLDAHEADELAALRASLPEERADEAVLRQLRTAADGYRRLTVAAIAADPSFTVPDAAGRTHEQILADRRRTLTEHQASYDSLLQRKQSLVEQRTGKGNRALTVGLLVAFVASAVAGIFVPWLLTISGLSLIALLILIARRSAKQKDNEAALVGINHDISHATGHLEGAKAAYAAAEAGVQFATLWRDVAPSERCPEGLDAPHGVERLNAQYERLQALKAKQKSATEQSAAATEALRASEQYVKDMLASMPGAPEDGETALRWLTEQRGLLLDGASRYERKRQEVAALQAQYATEGEEFRAALSAAEQTANEPSLDEQRQCLQGAQRTLGEQLMRGEQQLGELLAVLDERDAYEGERARKAAQLAEQKDNLDTILLTEKYLKLARENLSGRYLNTMKERFSYYMSLLSGKDAPVFTMDGQFRVKVREGGAARNTEAFSVGVRDLISLCERLSLLDAMFEGERPPLVLDDPFTNLDEQTTARALSLVRDVAARYQVLYLTCHPSRMPKNSD